MLKIQGLSYSYKHIKALEEINLVLDKGEMLGLVGPNGSGKTTILKCIARILEPARGTIFIDSKDVAGIRRSDLAKSLGYVPQSAPSRFPLTVFDAVLMGRRPYINWKPSQRDLDVVAGLLRAMELDDVALRDFDQLSGGQQQKVLLARAFSQEPDYLLLDEPTSNLDLKHQLEIMEMIAIMAKEEKIAALLAIHDLNLASRFSDRLMMLSSGRVFCVGKPGEVMTVENIKQVYGVEARISSNNGRPYILPIRPASPPEAGHR